MTGGYGFGFKEAQDIYSEWIQDIDRDKMASAFLSDRLVKKLNFKVKEAPELVGSLVTKMTRQSGCGVTCFNVTLIVSLCHLKGCTITTRC